jgi:hypothetical protein
MRWAVAASEKIHEGTSEAMDAVAASLAELMVNSRRVRLRGVFVAGAALFLIGVSLDSSIPFF